MTFSGLKSESKTHNAGVALTRLDERIARSPVGAGFLERQNFADACASLWIDGELAHLEDLVLHDAFRDIRTPTHELTIARDVLRTRRRISGQSADWALSAEGIRVLRQTSDAGAIGAEAAEQDGSMRTVPVVDRKGRGTIITRPKICRASISPPSMLCSPDRRLRSRLPNEPAVASFRTETR